MKKLREYLRRGAPYLIGAPYAYLAVVPALAVHGLALRDVTDAKVFLLLWTLPASLAGFFLWARLHETDTKVRSIGRNVHRLMIVGGLAIGALGLYRFLEGGAGEEALTYFALISSFAVICALSALGDLHDDWSPPPPIDRSFPVERMDEEQAPGPFAPSRFVVWKPNWKWLPVAVFGLGGGGFLIYGAAGFVLQGVWMGALAALFMGLPLLLGGLTAIAGRSIVRPGTANSELLFEAILLVTYKRRALPLAEVTRVAVRSYDIPGYGTYHRIKVHTDQSSMEVAPRIRDGSYASGIAKRLARSVATWQASRT
ncbi:MAG: hypothetical protein ACYTFT_16025 [Planctomycetota bacterium]